MATNCKTEHCDKCGRRQPPQSPFSIRVKHNGCFWKVGCAICRGGFDLRPLQPEILIDGEWEAICNDCYCRHGDKNVHLLPLLDVLQNWSYALSRDEELAKRFPEDWDAIEQALRGV